MNELEPLEMIKHVLFRLKKQHILFLKKETLYKAFNRVIDETYIDIPWIQNNKSSISLIIEKCLYVLTAINFISWVEAVERFEIYYDENKLNPLPLEYEKLIVNVINYIVYEKEYLI